MTPFRRLKTPALALFGGLAMALMAGTPACATDAAYLWANDPSAASYAPAGNYAFNAGAPVTVSRTGLGLYQVQLGAIVSGAGGNVQVTAYGLDGDYCHVESWTGGIVRVRCFNANASAGDTQFSLLVLRAEAGEANDELAYVWANQPNAASYTPDTSYTYNNGNPVTVTRSATGVYRVNLGSVVGNAGGNAQVTAYGPDNRRCKVENWFAGAVNVRCFDGGGSAADSRFSLSFVRANPSDEGLAYVWANDATSPNYTPDPTYSFNDGAPVSITRSGTGTYQVQLGAIVSGDGQNAQVTAYGPGNEHCKVIGWGGGSVNVRCFATDGSPTDSLFSLFVGRFPD